MDCTFLLVPRLRIAMGNEHLVGPRLKRQFVLLPGYGDE